MFEWEISDSLSMTEKTNSINSDKVLTADFNGDGITDLYVRDADRGKYDVIDFGDINGNFGGGTIKTGLNLGQDISFIDFNRDGYVDIFSAHKKTITIWKNDGKGNFTSKLSTFNVSGNAYVQAQNIYCFRTLVKTMHFSARL